VSKHSLSIIHTESSCGWGGQEIRILTETEGLIRRGHHVTLVAPEESCIAQAALTKKIPTVTLPIARKNVAALYSLICWLKRQPSRFDIINTHSSTDSWLSAIACLFLSNPPSIIRTRHVSSPVNKNPPTYWLYQKAVDHVVTTGEALRQQLRRVNNFAEDSMTSVPTGIDLQRFSPLPPGQTKTMQRANLGLSPAPCVGILATLRNWKGHAYLLEAFALLVNEFPEWNLLIVGDGPQRNNLERQAQKLSIHDRVKFAGNRNDPEQWLRAMDVFVLPSYGDEGVPQSIMQAMACGLPVVSTPVGAIREAVVEYSTGLLVPPKNEVLLANSLNSLMCNIALREKFAHAGWSRAQQNFGIDIMLDRMEEVFLTHSQRRNSCAV